MLNEVFGAVFSKQGARASLWLALLALLFTLAGAAVVLPWLISMGFPANRVRPVAATNSTLSTASFLALLVALFLLASYAHTALIDLARRLRAGEKPDIEGALRGKGQRALSYAGGFLLFSLIQGVAVVILAAIIAAFVFGIGVPALGGPGTAPATLPSPRGPVVQASPPPFDLGAVPQTVSIPVGLIGSLLLGFLLLVMWVTYFSVRLTFFRYAVAVDGQRAVAAIKASWQLTRGRWWSLFGTFLLLGLVLLVITAVAAFVAAIPFGLLFGGSVVGILVFGVAAVLAFEVLWYLFGIPTLFYAGLVAYEELKRAQAPGSAAP